MPQFTVALACVSAITYYLLSRQLTRMEDVLKPGLSVLWGGIYRKPLCGDCLGDHHLRLFEKYTA